MNIQHLCDKINTDVQDIMNYLGFNINPKHVMPKVLLVEKLDISSNSCNHNEIPAAGYAHEANEVYLPMSLLNEPQSFMQAIAHELCHSLQCKDRLLGDLLIDNYYFRSTEKEAFMVGSLMEARFFYQLTLSTLTKEKVISNMENAWFKLQVNSLQ